MTREKLLKAGVIGTIVTALCCFTPILVILVTAVGLSAIVGWLDYMLFPVLAAFIAITACALWMRQQPA
jgi:mercuric ion transport protein